MSYRHGKLYHSWALLLEIKAQHSHYGGRTNGLILQQHMDEINTAIVSHHPVWHKWLSDDAIFGCFFHYLFLDVSGESGPWFPVEGKWLQVLKLLCSPSFPEFSQGLTLRYYMFTWCAAITVIPGGNHKVYEFCSWLNVTTCAAALSCGGAAETIYGTNSEINITHSPPPPSCTHTYTHTEEEERERVTILIKSALTSHVT